MAAANQPPTSPCSDWTCWRSDEEIKMTVETQASAIKVLFMGTPAFAVPSLRALVAAGYRVVAVVTQPDRPAGRGGALAQPPIKLAAHELGLPVLQPPKLRSPEVVAELQTLGYDLAVVAAYGEILRPNVLAIPPLANLNVHASLLPRQRGAAPINAAILAGDQQAGVTIMLMDAGMDTGPMLAQRAIPVAAAETTASLTVKLADLGAELLLATLPAYLGGTLQPQAQDNALATYTSPLQKDDGKVDWAQPAAQIERMVRAYDPWPAAFTHWQGRRLKLVRVAVAAPASEEAVGAVYRRTDGQVAVRCGTGDLLLHEVQLEGKGSTAIKAFVNGYQEFVGSKLGLATFVLASRREMRCASPLCQPTSS